MKAMNEASAEDTLQILENVSKKQDLNDLATRLSDVRQFLTSELTDVELTLAQIAQQNHSSELLRNTAQHLLQLPGKRIRALCVVLAAKILGKPYDARVRQLAVACELVHTATLLHDDVIDDSEDRRGAKSARMVYGNSASILAGDHLLIEALRLVQTAHCPNLLTDLLSVIGQMVTAEALQLEARGRFEPSRATYLQVIEGKTAALFCWGLKAGALDEPVDAIQHEALSKLGLNLGIAFQLMDDVLDFTSDPSTLGKEVLVDLREGKLTWPLILAAEKDANFCAALKNLCHNKDADKKQLAELMSNVQQSGAIEQTQAFAREHADNALMALSQLPQNEATEALVWVVEAAIGRVY